MSPRRRLTGIAALSAVTLATAGVAAAAAAADDEPEGLAQLRSLIEAFGGEEVPDEALVQILGMYEAMGIDPATVLGVADPTSLVEVMSGGEVDESAFLKLFLGGAGSDGSDPQTDVFAKLMADAMSGEEIDGAAFLKLMLGEEGLDDDAFLKIGDLAVPDAETADDEVFHKITSPIANVEAALAEAAAQGDIDPATLQAILELLPEE